MAQLYADEDFSYPVIQQLRQLGHSQSGGTTPPEAVQTWDALVHELRQRTHPAMLTAHPNARVTLPARPRVSLTA